MENKPLQNTKRVLKSIRINKKKVSKKYINISKLCSYTANKIVETGHQKTPNTHKHLHTILDLSKDRNQIELK